MASPQIENGFTRISNELMDTLARQSLNGTQWRIIITVFRYTYGFQRKDYELSEAFIAKVTGIHRKQIGRELSILIKNNFLTVKKEASFSSSRVLAFNKNYDAWVSTKTLTGDENAPPGELVDPTGIGLVDPTGIGLVDHIKKDKETLKKNEYEQFFDTVWKLYPRKEGKSDILKSQAKLKEIYSKGFDRMKTAIDNYKLATKGCERKFIMQGKRFFGGAFTDYLPENIENEREIQNEGGNANDGYEDFTGRF